MHVKTSAGGAASPLTSLVFNALISLTFILIAHVLVKKEMLYRIVSTEEEEREASANIGKPSSSASAPASPHGRSTRKAEEEGIEEEDDELLRYIDEGEPDEEDDDEEVVVVEGREDRSGGSSGNGGRGGRGGRNGGGTNVGRETKTARLVSSAYPTSRSEVKGGGFATSQHGGRIIREYPDEKSINGGVVFDDMGVRGTLDGVPRSMDHSPLA